MHMSGLSTKDDTVSHSQTSFVLEPHNFMTKLLCWQSLIKLPDLYSLELKLPAQAILMENQLKNYTPRVNNQYCKSICQGILQINSRSTPECCTDIKSSNIPKSHPNSGISRVTQRYSLNPLLTHHSIIDCMFVRATSMQLWNITQC